MSNQKRSNSNRKSTATKRSTATSYSANKRRKAVNNRKARKQHMPRQNKMVIIICLAILCVGLIFPEVLPEILGASIARIVKWVAIFGILLAILMTRYRKTITEGIGWLYDTVINPYGDWDDDFDDDEDDEDDEDEEYDDEEDDEDEFPQPIRTRAPRRVVEAEDEEEDEDDEAKPQQAFTQEDYELFMQFMALRNAANQQSEADKPKKTKK